MTSRSVVGLIAAGLALAAAPPPAAGRPVALRFGFGTAARGQQTTGHVEVDFATDDSGRPRQLRGLDFRFPSGTRIDRSVAPVCSATDQEIDQRGADACPLATQVGWGRAHASTGFGAPIDPFPSDAHTFNTATGTVNVFTPPGTTFPAVWRTRQRYDGLWVKDSFPAPQPGFPPPDGKSLPLDAEFTLDKHAHGRSWLTTPRSCPRRRGWIARAVLTYADGTSETVRATTTCAHGRRR